MVKVKKSIFISGQYDMEYQIESEGNTISVYAKDFEEPYDMENPILVLSKEEAWAISRALGQLASGY